MCSSTGSAATWRTAWDDTAEPSAPHRARRLIALAPLLASVAVLGCGMPPPRVPLGAARLAEGPAVVQRDDGLYLRYRVDASTSSASALRQTVLVRRDGDRACYYFAGIQGNTELEWGAPVELSLRDDGVEDLARRGRLCWLDPDGTQHPIPLVRSLR